MQLGVLHSRNEASDIGSDGIFGLWHFEETSQTWIHSLWYQLTWDGNNQRETTMGKNENQKGWEEEYRAQLLTVP